MLFGKKDKISPQSQTIVSADASNTAKAAMSGVKFPNPKVLLIDVHKEVEAKLRADGFNITTGSFGSPFRVARHGGIMPVISNDEMPVFLAEQQLVVIDLLRAIDDVPDEYEPASGVRYIWFSRESGTIDPRLISMAKYKEQFDRILSHGGVFVIFAAEHEEHRAFFGTKDELERSFNPDTTLLSNYGFLTELIYGIAFTGDYGEEIYPAGSDHNLYSFVARHIKNGGNFSCTFAPNYRYEKQWGDLAKNKFGGSVACLLLANDKEDDNVGLVFLFPQVKDKVDFLSDFLANVLPELKPSLFPHSENTSWIHSSEYELPIITKLQNTVEEINSVAKTRVEQLQAQIEIERDNNDYLYRLTYETGDALKNAVKNALSKIGFQNIVDVDEEIKSKGKTSGFDEDLQIFDDGKVVLVETKGLNGGVKDDDAFQIQKHVVPRMRQWNRTDVQGLALINTQRGLPPLLRAENPFRDLQIENAVTQGFGLMTTWNFHRLVRNALKLNWTPEQVKPVLYRTGLVEPIPEHYEYVGVIEVFWPNHDAVGVRVTDAPLYKGDLISFELPVEFEEQSIESLQVDKDSRENAQITELAGIKTPYSKSQLQKGVRVFRHKTQTNSIL